MAEGSFISLIPAYKRQVTTEVQPRDLLWINSLHAGEQVDSFLAECMVFLVVRRLSKAFSHQSFELTRGIAR
jgi:hypothetical protein